jgi:hypothetical protein
MIGFVSVSVPAVGVESARFPQIQLVQNRSHDTRSEQYVSCKQFRRGSANKSIIVISIGDYLLWRSDNFDTHIHNRNGFFSGPNRSGSCPRRMSCLRQRWLAATATSFVVGPTRVTRITASAIRRKILASGTAGALAEKFRMSDSGLLMLMFDIAF